MFFMKAFFRRITKDFQQKELLPLKLLFFVHASTLFVLYPYLTIHMRELGINVEETAIMSAVTPVVAIIMPPLAGMVADRIGNFRILLAIFSALGGGASLLLLLVPVGRVTVTYPDHVIMDIGCSIPPGLGQDGFLELGLTGNEPCHYVDSLRRGHLHQVNTTLEACGFVCQPDIGGQITPMSPALLSQTKDDQEISQRILRARSYDVIISSSYPNNITDTYSYQLTSEQMPAIDVDHDEDLRSNSLRKNIEFYRTAIRNLSENSYFFPTSGLYNLTCTLVSDSNYETENRTEVKGSTMYQCKFGSGVGVEEGISGIQPSRKSYVTSLFPLTLDVGNRTERLFLAPSLFNWTGTEYDKSRKDGNFNATCSDIYSQKDQRVSISVALRNPENNLEVDRIVQLSSCRTRCLVTIPRNETCTNLKIVEVHDMSLTFWSYLVVRVFIGMIGGTAFAMFEGAVIAILREQSADYGLQRIYATIGGMISSPLSGMLIDYASRGKGYTDFRPAFYLYAGLKIASGLLMLTINLEFKAPAKNVVSDVASVLKNIEIVALFIAIFILGTAWGYIESFLFWLLQDLGGSRSLMGITITVGGIAGIPLLVLSGPIIDRIGHANVLFIGFMFYSIRLVGYSLIYNPWLCLIFEAMESVTSSLSFTAAVTYAAKLSTTTTDSSIQGLLGGLYFGVGKGAGSLIGGYMMKAFGTRPTYRIFAVACAITGLVYFLFNKFYLRKRPQSEGNDIVKKKPQVILVGDTVEIDLNAGQKEKELNNGTNSDNNANNNRMETFPINTTASKSYSSADKNLIAENNAKNTNSSTKYHNNNKEIENKSSNKPNEPINELKECNVNLAYDDTSEDDDYATISEQDDGDVSNAKVQMTTKDEPSNNGKGDKENGCSDVKGNEQGNKDCDERSSAKENSAT